MPTKKTGTQVLLPANVWFIRFSLLAALLLDLLPLGRAAWMPDFLAVVLVFWNIRRPQRIGLAVGFFFGLALDVHQAALLGQNALAYSVLSYFAVMIHRRVLWYPWPTRLLQLFLLFSSSHLIITVIRRLAGGMLPGWQALLAPILETLMWPIIFYLLEAPQRRAPDPDANRPI